MYLPLSNRKMLPRRNNVPNFVSRQAQAPITTSSPSICANRSLRHESCDEPLLWRSIEHRSFEMCSTLWQKLLSVRQYVFFRQPIPRSDKSRMTYAARMHSSIHSGGAPSRHKRFVDAMGRSFPST